MESVESHQVRLEMVNQTLSSKQRRKGTKVALFPILFWKSFHQSA